MPAMSPEEICVLFREYMALGDLASLLGLYDREAVFLNQSQEAVRGREGLRTQLAPLAAARTQFEYSIKQVIRTGDIALMHTQWTVSGSQPIEVYAIEVARRQTDGSWCWLIGDPYTVGREVGICSRR